MTLDDSIYALLSAPSSATYAQAGDRVYPVEALQGPLPLGRSIVYQQIAGTAATTHGVAGDAEDTLDETLYQFSCYAPTIKEAKAMRRALRSDLLLPQALTGIVVTGPVERSGDEPETLAARADLDLTFFHNPLTA